MFTNLPLNNPLPQQQRRAFTLMEVVIALTILGMITGTLFTIIQGSVRAANMIGEVQRENDAINRFLDLCRKAFTTLPSTATLKLTALDPNNPVSSGQELTISGSTHCFSFGINSISYEDTILGLRPDPDSATDTNGQLIQYLCLSRADLIPETGGNQIAMRQETTGLAAPDEQGRYWMPLLPKVIQLKWRFYKEADDTWLEEWDDSEWPNLIEIQLLMSDRTTPIRMVYSVPTIQIVAGTPTSTSGSGSTQNAQGNQAGGNNQGGGNQGGGQGGGPGGGQGGGGRPGGGGGPGGGQGGGGRPGGGGGGNQGGGGGPGGGNSTGGGGR